MYTQLQKKLYPLFSGEYTLPQKKRNFNPPIFPGAPGFLTLT